MAAGIELEADGAAVLVPCGAAEVVLVGEELCGGDDGTSRLHLEDAGRLLHEVVAGLGVLLLVELRLQLVGRRRLDVIDIALLGHGADFVSGDVAAVGRPAQPRRVVVSQRAVEAQGACPAASGGAYPDVAVADEGHPFAVGRGDFGTALFVVHLHPVALLWRCTAHAAEAAGVLGRGLSGENVLPIVIHPVPASSRELQGVASGVHTQALQVQLLRLHLALRLFAEELGEFLSIEEGT